MSTKYRFWFVVYPDITKPVGGIKQIHRLAEILVDLGHIAFLVQDDPGFHPNWFSSNVNTVSKKEWLNSIQFNALDIIVLAETYLPALDSIHPSVPKIIFNQNGAYSFGLPSTKLFKPSYILSLYKSPSIVQVWCVSESDRCLLVHGFGLPPDSIFLLVNGIEPNIGNNIISKKKQISFMSRKNILDSAVVTTLLKSQTWLSDWQIVPIENCSQLKVVQIMGDSLIYLSFGHPEGFGLPVAEAMASGCAVVGYHGLGGRELYHLAEYYKMCKSVDVGDWLGFVEGVYYIYSRSTQNHVDFANQSRLLSSTIRNQYSLARMSDSVAQAVHELRLSD